jgi:hypothetical protein
MLPLGTKLLSSPQYLVHFSLTIADLCIYPFWAEEAEEARHLLDGCNVPILVLDGSQDAVKLWSRKV